MQKRRRLKLDAAPTIFNRPAATAAASQCSLQEGPSVGHKRAAVTGDESTPVEKKKKPAFEERERAIGCGERVAIGYS